MVIRPWQGTNKSTDLFSEKVQIWSAFFDQENCSSYFDLLSKDEKTRAGHLMDPGAASRQIISRGILRLLLGSYTGKDPKALAFSYSEFGKPFLSNPANSEICFNLSHSGDLLLIAVARGEQIGIDVEKNENNIDISGIAALVFSAEEQFSVSQSANPIHEFYELWTAKEAILKSTGLGFSYPSNQFSVVKSKDHKSRLRISKDLPAGSGFSLATFSPAEGYSAAIAVMH
jgi:4'-phosphopantetheinyl transferase